MSSALYQLKRHLYKKHQLVQDRLKKKHPRTHKLLKQKSLLPGKLRHHAAKLLAGATMASMLLAQPSALSMLPGKAMLDHAAKSTLPSTFINETVHQQAVFSSHLKSILPADRAQLNPWEIGEIDHELHQRYGIHANAELTAHRLNHQYGLIGHEQHLKRFPGDTLRQHGNLQTAGMAPGLSAWGYFANSKAKMTETDILREKYYVAVQTLYLPNWNDNHQELKDWYKHRKMIVINPTNGHAVVAVIGDAGPALRTGKQFGGSPEVMQALNLHEGPRSGKVVMLFVDDPEDKIPLGPVGTILTPPAPS